MEPQLQHHAAEQFPDQTAAETELTPALATAGEPAFHQLLKIFPKPEQLQQLFAVLALVKYLQT